jgi:hypothetical protein
MPVDAGSISSEVRIKLSALSSDIAACRTAFDNLGKEFSDKADKYSTLANKSYVNALKGVAKETKNVEAATKAGALSEREGIQRLIDLRQTELAVLQKRAIAEQGTNAATISAINKTNSAITALNEQQRLLGTTSLSSGEKLKNMFASMRDVMQGPVAAFSMVKNIIAGIARDVDAYIMKASAMEKAQAILKSTLAATGASAWTSAAKLNEYAEAMAKATLFEDDQITDMQNVLLGFKNIQGINFTKASDEILNMATVMKMDLASAAQAVGKALDDPIEGINSLTRQGFRFSDEQKKVLKVMVETGDIASAQNIIIKELSTTYGGAAVAAANNATGSYINMKQSLADLGDQIGVLLANSADWKGFGEFVNKIADGVDRLNKIGASKNKLADLQALMSTRGFKNLSLRQQSEEISNIGLSIDEAGSAIVILDDRIKELKKSQSTPWGWNVQGQKEIKDLEAQKKGIEGVIDVLRVANDVKAASTSASQKAAEAEKKRIADEALRIELLKKYKDLQKENADQAKSIIDGQKNESTKLYEQYVKLAATPAANGELEKQRQEALKILSRLMEEAALKEIADAKKVAEEKNKLDQATFDKALSDQADADIKRLAMERSYLTGLEGLDTAALKARAAARKKALGLEGNDDEAALKKKLDSLKSYSDMALNILNAIADLVIENDKRELDSHMDALEKRIEAEENAYDEIYENQTKAAEDAYDAQTKAAERAYQIQREAAEAMYSGQMDALEEWYQLSQDLIEYDGQTKMESLQAQLDKALADGDTQKAADLQKEIDQINLKAEYDAKRKQLEDTRRAEEAAAEKRYSEEKEARDRANDEAKAAREKANDDAKAAREKKNLYDKAMLEYKYAKTKWGWDLTSAIANAALSTLNGFLTQPFVPAGLIAGSYAAVIGGLQIASVAGAQPQPPAMATGGLVLPSGGGSGTPVIAGDRGGGDIMFGTSAMGSPLMDAFADLVASKVASQTGPGFITVQSILDGKVVAQSTVRYINNGQVRMNV